MDDSAWWRDVATRSKTSVVDLPLKGDLIKSERAQRKKRDHGKETTIEFRQNGTTTMHPIQDSVFKPFPCHCFYLCFFGTTKTLFFFFPIVFFLEFWVCVNVDDVIGWTGEELIVLAWHVGKDDGTAFAVDERGNGEVWRTVIFGWGRYYFYNMSGNGWCKNNWLKCEDATTWATNMFYVNE